MAVVNSVVEGAGIEVTVAHVAWIYEAAIHLFGVC